MPTDPHDPASGVYDDQPALWLEEFRQLRTTIRQRGSVRAVVSFITFVSWGATLIALRGTDTWLLQAIPLLILAAGFEVAFGLHAGAERIGRYLYTFYEGPAQLPKWESAIALFGQSPAAKAIRLDALLVPEFVVALVVNLLVRPANTFVLPAAPVDRLGLILLLGLHVAVFARIVRASRSAARQRDVDGAAFRDVASKLHL